MGGLRPQCHGVGREPELPYADVQVHPGDTVGQPKRGVVERELPHNDLSAHQRPQCHIGPQPPASKQGVSGTGHGLRVVHGQPQRKTKPQPLDAELHPEVLGNISDGSSLDEILYRRQIHGHNEQKDQPKEDGQNPQRIFPDFPDHTFEVMSNSSPSGNSKIQAEKINLCYCPSFFLATG